MICVAIFDRDGYPPAPHWQPAAIAPAMAVRAPLGSALRQWLEPYEAFEQDGISCALIPKREATTMSVAGVVCHSLNRVLSAYRVA